MSRKELKYFKIEEFDCPDEKGSAAKYMDFDFLLKLDKAREISGVPYKINSGARTPERNKKVGGKPDSAHLTTRKKGCCAADISYLGSRARYKIINGLIKAGINRIGIHEVFIHADGADAHGDKAPDVIWLYK